MGSGPTCTCTEMCVGILSVADQWNAVWMGYIPLTIFNRTVILISTIMHAGLLIPRVRVAVESWLFLHVKPGDTPKDP